MEAARDLHGQHAADFLDSFMIYTQFYKSFTFRISGTIWTAAKQEGSNSPFIWTVHGSGVEAMAFSPHYMVSPRFILSINHDLMKGQ